MLTANPSARLVLFTYSGITALTHACITKEVSSWPNLQHRIKTGDAAIDRARDTMASEFLQDPDATDVLLMVDDDVQWDRGDLAYIARAALECNAVVGGAYPKRGFGQQLPVRFHEELRGDFTFGTEELLPAAYVATGFIAIPRTVLQAVADTLPLLIDNTWPLFLPRVVDGSEGKERLSEDWAFCSRATDAGFDVLVAMAPKLTHIGKYQFRTVDSTSVPLPDQEITIKVAGPNPVFTKLVEDLGAFCSLKEDQVRLALAKGTGEVVALWSTKPEKQTDLAFYKRDDVGQAYLFDLADWHRKTDEVLVGSLENIRDKTVLDYGSGIGTTALLLARAGNTVDCVEPNEVMRDFTQFRSDRLQIPVAVRNGGKLGSYDVVVCWHVLEHVSDPEKLAAKLIAALKPGGLLFADSDFTRNEVKPMHHTDSDPTGARFWDGLERTSRFWWTKVERD